VATTAGLLYFREEVEQMMGTDSLDNCPANSSIDAWSPDFNGGAMSSGDLVAFGKYYAGSGRLDTKTRLPAPLPSREASDGGLYDFSFWRPRGEWGLPCTMGIRHRGRQLWRAIVGCLES